MSLRSQITGTYKVNEIIIEVGEDKYKFIGRPDVGFFNDNFIIDPMITRRNSIHFQSIVKDKYPDSGVVVDEQFVRNIQLIHTTLVAETWNAKTSTWVKENPYDITEILCLAVEQGALLVQYLLPGALAAIGITAQDVEEGNNPLVDEALAGN